MENRDWQYKVGDRVRLKRLILPYLTPPSDPGVNDIGTITSVDNPWETYPSDLVYSVKFDDWDADYGVPHTKLKRLKRDNRQA